MLAEVSLPLPIKTLFTYRVPEPLASSIRVGHHVMVPFGFRMSQGVVVALKDPKAETAKLKDIHHILNPGEPVSEALLQLTKWIAGRTGASWGEALSILFAPPKKPKKVEPSSANVPSSDVHHHLTHEQNMALHSILGAVSEKKQKNFLLFGVTSSGKTEVYLRAIEAVVSKNQGNPKPRQALFLVPEISLCHPFYEILRRRFGERVGVWHSQITRSEKGAVAARIASGDIDIVVGARSALFSPVPSPGIIILDEEHDSSYKQQEKPRYHAREAALELARIHGSVIVMGSATPSIETFHRARNGDMELLRLSKRIPGHSIPEITVFDRKTSLQKGSPFSKGLEDAITQALARREQTIIALNRRGFSTFLLCGNCGFSWKCPNCLLTLVHHWEHDGKKESLKCHACFEESPMPKKCEKCGSESIFLGGAGTQKIVQELKKRFPYARILRLDRDVMKKKSAYSETYQTFKDESGDILVGTQMVTQGFDFPRVTLVGIVDADTALYHPDFRSAERTFQWITQAAGRAGRSPMGGKVIVQTSVPDHYAVLAGRNLDYEKFFEQEIEFRKTLLYPPFSQLVLFRFESSSKKDSVPLEAERFSAVLEEALQGFEGRFRILGPGPSPREQLMKKIRWQVLLKCMDDAVRSKAVTLAGSFHPKSGVRMITDVDPSDLL